MGINEIASSFLFNTGGPPPAKNHPGVNRKHGPVEEDNNNRSKHQAATSKPAWLLALEIVTGVMVGSLFIVALLAASQKCKSKPSLIIPWKKSTIAKDHMAIYIGKNVAFYSYYYYEREGKRFWLLNCVESIQIRRC